MYQEKQRNTLQNGFDGQFSVLSIRFKKHKIIYVHSDEETDNKPVESMLPNLHIYNETAFKRMQTTFQEASQV